MFCINCHLITIINHKDNCNLQLPFPAPSTVFHVIDDQRVKRPCYSLSLTNKLTLVKHISLFLFLQLLSFVFVTHSVVISIKSRLIMDEISPKMDPVFENLSKTLVEKQFNSKLVTDRVSRLKKFTKKADRVYFTYLKVSSSFI